MPLTVDDAIERLKTRRLALLEDKRQLTERTAEEIAKLTKQIDAINGVLVGIREQPGLKLLLTALHDAGLKVVVE